jgi:hypothetical protein
MPPFMSISVMMGPLTTAILAKDVVELKSEVTPVEANARITGDIRFANHHGVGATISH